MRTNLRQFDRIRIDQIVIAVLIPIIILFLFFSGALLIDSQTMVYRYPILKEPITNPLMGWSPWASSLDPGQPHSLVYADLTWRDLEPKEGEFDFRHFEEENQLIRWRNEGIN